VIQLTQVKVKIHASYHRSSKHSHFSIPKVFEAYLTAENEYVMYATETITDDGKRHVTFTIESVEKDSDEVPAYVKAKKERKLKQPEPENGNENENVDNSISENEKEELKSYW
jgi:hypothetical protein